MKTSEVLKKKLGNISETVKEVNVAHVTFRCLLSDFQMIAMLLKVVFVCACRD